MLSSRCKCLSNSDDNRSGDILFLRYDLILLQQENKRFMSFFNINFFILNFAGFQWLKDLGCE